MFKKNSIRISFLVISLLFAFSVSARSSRTHGFKQFFKKITKHYKHARRGQIVTWNGEFWVPRAYRGLASLPDDSDRGEQYIWDGEEWVPHIGNSNSGVTEVVAGNGLLANGELGGSITSNGVLDINIGQEAGQIPYIDNSGVMTVTGEIRSLDGGFVFPDGSVQLTASEGIAGPQGLQGLKGETGAVGLQGLQGVAGLAGADGAAGIAGPQGLQGLKGETGAIGPQGLQGVAGLAGADGTAGIAGPQGLQGLKGETGAVGPQGLQGVAGLAGADGAAGIAGPQGLQGLKGETGAIGPQGLQGVAGLAGADGAAGIAGPQGLQGLKGETGAIGPQGLQGVAGLAGADGTAGIAGPQGLQGLKGEAGEAGSDASVNLIAGIGIKGTIISSTGTVSVDVGTSAGQIPQLDSTGRLPASVLPDAGNSVKVAYLKDVKPSGAHGGTCTANGVWDKRDLTELTGDTSFVSLSNNQFILQPGTYNFDGEAPALITNNHQAKLVDADSGATILIGTSAYSRSSTPTLSSSTIKGAITITVATTFKIVHQCAYSYVDYGFGFAAGFAGSKEVYTQLTVTKID